MSKSTFGNLLKGEGRPRLETVEAFVDACARHARERRPPLRLSSEALDLTVWRARYETAFPSLEVPSRAGSADEEFAAAKQEYVARLRQRYGRVDLEILTPLSEPDEHPPVQLRDVFVAQAVRANPPPVELPKELWRRLTEIKELSEEDLPESLDPRLLSQIWQAYQERPARSVLQVLVEPDQRRMVLLGDPGAGKSTLTRYLVLALAEGSPQGPLADVAGEPAGEQDVGNAHRVLTSTVLLGPV